MQLGDYLVRERVLPDLQATDKAGVLRELLGFMESENMEQDAEAALRVLLDRESLGTTGIGDGIAIPHGKLEALEHICVVVGRSKKGVEFEALDHKPCHIFFLVLAPEQVAGMHLRLLAQISRLLKDETFRQAFMDAEDGDALWKLLKSV